MERKTLKWHYDVDRLLEIGRDRGYRNRQELYQYLMACMRYRKGYNQFRVKMQHGRITVGQIKLFADALQMTPEEMLDVWFSDTFITVGNRTFAELTEEDKDAFCWKTNELPHFRNLNTRKPKKTSVEENAKRALEEINALIGD